MHKLPADGHSDAEARYKQGCHSTLISALTRGRTSPNRPANTVARGRSGILSTGRLNAWLATVCMRAEPPPLTASTDSGCRAVSSARATSLAIPEARLGPLAAVMRERSTSHCPQICRRAVRLRTAGSGRTQCHSLIVPSVPSGLTHRSSNYAEPH